MNDFMVAFRGKPNISAKALYIRKSHIVTITTDGIEIEDSGHRFYLAEVVASIWPSPSNLYIEISDFTNIIGN